MKIGFFGDSYCDLVYFNNDEYRSNSANWSRQYKPWSGKLLDDWQSPILSSGLGGSSLYDSVCKWNEDQFKDSYDVVFWSLTWHNRLYTSEYFQPVFLARAERRPLPISDIPNVSFEEIDKSIDLYYKYFYYDNQHRFYYEQTLKWIFDLPDQYKNTKFIFLPCTEYARNVSKTSFKEGILVNFSFETLSNLEPNSPGPMPMMCGRLGHLSDRNHECMAKLMTNLINGYSQLNGKIFDPDLSNFDLTEIPQFS
jgi:hypothetical protein